MLFKESFALQLFSSAPTLHFSCFLLFPLYIGLSVPASERHWTAERDTRTEIHPSDPGGCGLSPRQPDSAQGRQRCQYSARLLWEHQVGRLWSLETPPGTVNMYIQLTTPHVRLLDVN